MMVPPNRLPTILAGSRGITAEMGLDLQAAHDLEVARRAQVGSDVATTVARAWRGACAGAARRERSRAHRRHAHFCP